MLLSNDASTHTQPLLRSRSLAVAYHLKISQSFTAIFFQERLPVGAMN